LGSSDRAEGFADAMRFLYGRSETVIAAATHLGRLPHALQRLGGPVLDKELRVASRQRRYYLLRFAYACLLMTIVVCLWSSVVRFGGSGSPVVQASRLAEAGKRIVATIIWFQFIGGQILAVALLSDAISGEVRQRTLDGILVAPMGNLYIVVGKLASRLLQIVLLLTISLPLLAVVRVLGGVSWSYVVSGLCITLTTAIFAGSLSLFASMTRRHAYEAIVLVGLWYFVVWGVLSGLLRYLSLIGYVNGVVTASILFLANPFTALSATTETMLSKAGGITAPVLWPLHCLVMLLAAAIVLIISVRRVRKASSASASARTGASPRDFSAWRTRAKDRMSGRTRAQTTIRCVKGPPVEWKDLLASSLSLGRHVLLTVVVLAGILLSMVFLSVFFRSPAYVVLVEMSVGVQLGFVISLAVSAAGAITKEKEACTWPLLLATPLSNRQIVKSKITGVFRRNQPWLVWLCILYSLVFLLSPVSGNVDSLIAYAVICLPTTIVFLLGVGLYLSMRLKTTTAAVVWTLGLYFVPRFIFWSIFGSAVLVSGSRIEHKIAAVFALSTLPAGIYLGVGLLCMRAAARRLRCSVFEEEVRWFPHRRR
jgi:ABC-type transport system involved in multi-copper enzyme maturation permease subunit